MADTLHSLHTLFTCEGHHHFATKFDSSSSQSYILQYDKCKCHPQNSFGCHAVLGCRIVRTFSSLQLCPGADDDSGQKQTTGSWLAESCLDAFLKDGFRKRHRSSFASQRRKYQGARVAKSEDGQVLDWQWNSRNMSPLMNRLDVNAESEVEFKCSEPRVAAAAAGGFNDEEDQPDHKSSNGAQVVSCEDPLLEEHMLDKMGSSSLMKERQHIVEDIHEVEEQLQELYRKVSKMIDEGDDDTARALVEANYDAIMEQLESGLDGIEQAAMLDILAQLSMELRDFKEAEYLLEKAEMLMEKLSTPEPVVGSIFEHMGSMYTALGKPKKALPFLNRSLNIQESLHGQDSPLLTKTLLGLAISHNDLQNVSMTIDTYQRVLAILEKSYGSYDERLTVPLTHLGNVLSGVDRMDEAEILMRRALEILQKVHGFQDRRVGVATCALARVKGNIEDAIFLFTKGINIMEECKNLEPDDPALEAGRTDLAELFSTVGKCEEAQKLLETVLHSAEQAVGPNDFQLVTLLHNLANAYAQSGDFSKSELMVRRSLKLVTIHLGPNTPEVSVPLELLATILQQQRKHREAEPLARQALRLRETAYGEDHPAVGDACNCLAAILHSLGRNDEALTLMYRVLKIQERELDHESPQIGFTLQLIVVLLDRLERYAELGPIVDRLGKINAKAEQFMS